MAKIADLIPSKPPAILTRVISKSVDEDYYPFFTAIWLVYNEPLRRELARLNHAVQGLDPAENPWKAIAIHHWLIEYFLPVLQRFEKIKQNYLRPHFEHCGYHIPSSINYKETFLQETYNLLETISRKLCSLVTSRGIVYLDEVQSLLHELRTEVHFLTQELTLHFDEEEWYWPLIFQQEGFTQWTAVLSQPPKGPTMWSNDPIYELMLIMICQSMGLEKAISKNPKGNQKQNSGRSATSPLGSAAPSRPNSSSSTSTTQSHHRHHHHLPSIDILQRPWCGERTRRECVQRLVPWTIRVRSWARMQRKFDRYRQMIDSVISNEDMLGISTRYGVNARRTSHREGETSGGRVSSTSSNNASPIVRYSNLNERGGTNRDRGSPTSRHHRESRAVINQDISTINETSDAPSSKNELHVVIHVPCLPFCCTRGFTNETIHPVVSGDLKEEDASAMGCFACARSSSSSNLNAGKVTQQQPAETTPPSKRQSTHRGLRGSSSSSHHSSHYSHTHRHRPSAKIGPSLEAASSSPTSPKMTAVNTMSSRSFSSKIAAFSTYFLFALPRNGSRNSASSSGGSISAGITDSESHSISLNSRRRGLLNTNSNSNAIMLTPMRPPSLNSSPNSSVHRSSIRSNANNNNNNTTSNAVTPPANHTSHSSHAHSNENSANNSYRSSGSSNNSNSPSPRKTHLRTLPIIALSPIASSPALSVSSARMLSGGGASAKHSVKQHPLNFSGSASVDSQQSSITSHYQNNSTPSSVGTHRTVNTFHSPLSTSYASLQSPNHGQQQVLHHQVSQKSVSAKDLDNSYNGLLTESTERAAAVERSEEVHQYDSSLSMDTSWQQQSTSFNDMSASYTSDMNSTSINDNNASSRTMPQYHHVGRTSPSLGIRLFDVDDDA